MCDPRGRSDSVEFLEKVLRIMDWVKTDYRGENSSNLIGKRLQKELALAQVKLQEVGKELWAVKGEKEELLKTLVEKEKEIDKLRKELEREKWEGCDAKVNMKEMAKEVARLYWRIGELVERIRTGEVDDRDVQIIDEEDEHWESPTKKKKRGDENRERAATEDAFKLIRNQVEEQMKKWEEEREGTKKELARTNQFVENIKKLVQDTSQPAKTNIYNNTSVEVQAEISQSEPAIRGTVIKALKVVTETEVDSSLNLSQSPVPLIAMEAATLLHDQQQGEEEQEEKAQEAATLTLTFHRSSPSPPPLMEYPPQQLEFFHTLLGLPTETIISRTITNTTTPSPKATSPSSLAEFFNSPIKGAAGAAAVASNSNLLVPFPSPPPPPHSIQSKVEDETKEVYHATDPSKRHLGYFCTCGLECSTKKTLQYHLQYLQSTSGNNSNHSSSNAQISINTTPTIETEPTEQVHIVPSFYPPPPVPNLAKSMRIKHCKRCGQEYTGGKEGLRQHNLMVHQHHHEYSQNLGQGPVSDPHPHNTFTCIHCPELFRTMVQLRLHHKVKHSNSSSSQMNFLPY